MACLTMGPTSKDERPGQAWALDQIGTGTHRRSSTSWLRGPGPQFLWASVSSAFKWR